MKELSEIPKVEFLKKEKAEIEFEIFSLKSLFTRRNRLNPPIEKPHRVKFYQIIYLTKGRGFHHIDFKPYRITRGSLVFVSQGQVHAFDIQEDIDGFILLFTADFLAKNLIHSDIVSLYRLYNYHFHQPVIQPEEIKDEIFLNIINEIQREYDFPDSFAKEEMIRLLLKLLLLKAERIKRTIIGQEKNTEWFVRFGHFRGHLEKQYAYTRNVMDYAKMMSISPKHLNTICKALSGFSAKEFIDNYLVLEIKRQLATSSKSVKELSYDFGFDEPTNFVKYFKKHTGYSPTQIKNLFIK